MYSDIFKDSRIEVRKKNQLTKEELKKINLAKLNNFKDIQAWTAIGSNKELSYSTHGAMRFFGKFPPPIATYLINKFTKPNSLVIDPMCGSGTTAVECTLNKRLCEVFDVNPLMLLLTKVKTTPLNIKKINKEFKIIKKNYKPKKFSEKNYRGIKNIEHWFLKDTLNSLLGIKFLIDKIKNKNLKNFFLICFLSIVRRVSKATTQQGRLFLDIKTAQAETFSFFEKKVDKFKDSVCSLPGNKNIKIRNLSLLENKKNYKADLVILHPPYFNSYKYSSINSLELYWMNFDHAEIRKKEIREFFKVGKIENYKKFVDDMSKCLENAFSMLKKNGHLALMMGDTTIGGEYVRVVYETIIASKIKKSSIKTVALRVPKYTEASWATSQRRIKKNIGITLNDFIIIFKK
jgi:DNA modification methylase